MVSPCTSARRILNFEKTNKNNKKHYGRRTLSLSLSPSVYRINRKKEKTSGSVISTRGEDIMLRDACIAPRGQI